MLDIWTKTKGENHIKPIMATIYRFVESQEQIATLSLVNNVYEQGVLEELIESTKKPFIDKKPALHYLLKTPFRYPPLKYGSRFGTCHERSLFYGSLTIHTALAEAAYYRFIYILGPETPFPSVISSEHTSFTVAVRSNAGIFLDKEPFLDFAPILMSKTSYSATQPLGKAMRESGVQLFQYRSARDEKNGKNLALFTEKAFHSKKPAKLASWLCQTSTQEVGFLSKESTQKVLYTQKDFWADGVFPSAAL